MRFNILLGVLATIPAMPSLCQDNTLSAEFNQAPLSAVIDYLKEKTDNYFYYDPAWDKYYQYTFSFSGWTDDQVLDHLSKQSPIIFEYYSDNTIILFNRDQEKIFKSKTQLNTAGYYPTLTLGDEANTDYTRSYKVTGKIINGGNGEPITGAKLAIQDTDQRTISDPSGNFLFSLNPGGYLLEANSLGFEKERYNLEVYTGGNISIELFENTIELENFTLFSTSADNNISSTISGKNTIDISTLKKIPAVLGEVDVLKSVQTLPGVTSVGEVYNGFNVRGGSVDQNLILLDEAPIFNPSHVFGFFSIFNSDIINKVDFYRGGIPANRGGRLASLLHIEPNYGGNKLKLNGGINTLSSRLSIEGPIVKDKLTFMASGRASYSDWLLDVFDYIDLRNSSASFYDGSLGIRYNINEKNQISIINYLSDDQFRFASDTTFQWSNLISSFKYKHIVNEDLFLQLNLSRSNYQYNVNSIVPLNEYDLDYNITYLSANIDGYYTYRQHEFNAGYQYSTYQFQPGHIRPSSEQSIIEEKQLQEENTREIGIYLSDNITVNPDLSLSVGFRFSQFHYMGPQSFFVYDESESTNLINVIDSVSFGNGQKIKTYSGWEPRLSIRYKLNNNASLKFGGHRIYQYVHVISNAINITPFDIWKPSDAFIKPQISNQASIGYFRNIKNNAIETSAEIYYRGIENAIDYKNGAELVLNRNLETAVLQGDGRAYGLELSIRKNKGRLTGWVNYTLSRSELKFDSELEENTINDGEYYPVNFDRAHVLNLFGNYNISRRYKLGATFFYSSGRPIPAPVASFQFDNFDVPLFSARNQFRIQSSHRLDLSFTVLTNNKKNKKWEGSWTFSVFNVYGRKNPYSVFFRDPPDEPLEARQLIIFGAPIPTITYNFTFN